MLLEQITICLLLGIPATYVLHALLLQEKDSHEGPFPLNKNRFVIFKYDRTRDEWHYQRVALFDVIRRVFGAYDVEKEELSGGTAVENWIVKEGSALGQVWTCPFCLSFWISLLFSVPHTLFCFGFTWNAVLFFIPFHLTIAVVSQVIHRYIYGND